MNFAVIENETVTNIILADSKEIAEEATGTLCVEYTDENPAYMGYKYINGVFEKPPVE